MITGQFTHSRLQDAVIAALETAVREEAEVIANGVISDWPTYQKHRGRIEGLREAIEIAAEAEKKFNGNA